MPLSLGSDTEHQEANGADDASEAEKNKTGFRRKFSSVATGGVLDVHVAEMSTEVGTDEIANWNEQNVC